MDRGGRGIVRRAIGYLQPDSGQRSVSILGVSRFLWREPDPAKRSPGKSGCPNRGQNTGRVQPGGAHLLERSIRPPADRQIGPLEKAGAGVGKKAFQGTKI